MLDWDDLRSFLAIARSGTLSAAARELGVQQSTMSRRLDALEERAGVRMLQKTPAGFRLTAAGEAALAHVERMEQEALTVQLAVAGQDERLEGVVRLTTVGSIAASVLPPLLAAFRERYPAIILEVHTETHVLSLSRREADLSLWPMQPEGNELVARKVVDIHYGLYASAGYLDRIGMPDLRTGSPGHVVISRLENGGRLPVILWLQAMTSAATVGLRTISTDLMVAAALAGIGIAALPTTIAKRTALVRLDTPSPAPTMGLWLAVHEDTRRTPRIRALMDALSNGLRGSL